MRIVAQLYLAAFPVLQEVNFNVPQDNGGGFPTNNISTVARIDYNLTQKTQIFGRYAYENNKPFAGNYAGVNGYSPYSGFTLGTATRNQNAVISLTHQFTSNLISQTKVAYSRQRGLNSLQSDPTTPTLYANIAGPSSSRVFYAPGYLGTYSGNGVGFPTSGVQHFAQFNEDLTYILGNNSFRFGGQYIYIRDNETFGAYQNASQILGTTASTALRNLLAGTLQTFQTAVNPQGRFPGQLLTTPVGQPNFTRNNTYKEGAFYINDAWRVIPRLTLNLGVRYEYYGVQRNKDKSLESNFYFGSGSTLQQQVRNGTVQLSQTQGGLWKPDKNNFAPRVGFAYDLSGDGRTSIRGGYGIGYERNFGNVTFNVIQNPPNYAVLNVSNTPIFLNSTGPVSGTGVSVILPPVSLRAVDPNIKTAYAHFYSAAVEHRILKDTIASATFSGSNGRDLYSIANLNRPGSATRFLGNNQTSQCPAYSPYVTPAGVVIPTDPRGVLGLQLTRLNCQYGNINYRGNQGYSNYAGLTLALDSNNLFGQGLTVTNRYTLSKAKDNLSSTFSDGYQSNFALGFLDPYNPSFDYGPSDFDVRSRLVSSFVYDLPAAKYSDNRFVRGAFGGIQLTGQVEVRSGTPFSVYDCSNATYTTCTRLVPTEALNVTKSNRITSTASPNTFVYNDLSFQRLGTFGDVSPFGGNEVGPFPANTTGRNSFRGPGAWNVNFGAYKSILFTERYRLQLRAEAFNVFNHANYFINTTSLDLSNFGVVQASKAGNRNLQFAAKFIF